MKKRTLLLASLFTLILVPSIKTYAADFQGDGKAAIEVAADARTVITPDYQVILDPYLILSWDKDDDYVGSYKAAVKGTLPEGAAVSVKPDGDFTIKNGKKEYKGIVTQDKSFWINKDFSADEQGITDTSFSNALDVNKGEYTKGTAKVSIPGEGHFEGNISFTFKMEKLK